MHTQFFVYILAGPNRVRRVLYTGVTNDLRRRVEQHRCEPTGFVARYNLFALVYFETFGDVERAIAREKQIKGWRREKKIALIQGMNPYWHDQGAKMGW